jgi:glycosyltransferase involved in cell wall biosynthesis
VAAIARVKETVPDIRCKIIGTGPERKLISKLISKLSLKENIQMIERVERHEDLYGLMKASKMLVLPSVREGFGLTVIEANAAGIPVITTSHENNAAKDLILEGVNGLLVEPNETDIAKKIIQLLNRGADMDVRRDIEQYDWSRVVKHLEQAIGLRNE